MPELKTSDSVGVVLAGLLYLLYRDGIPGLFTDPDIHAVPFPAALNGFSQGGLDADQALQGIPPDARHKAVNLLLVVILKVEGDRIV